MSSWAKPGVKCVCVDGSPNVEPYGHEPVNGYPVVGQVYAIGGTVIHPISKRLCVRLVGLTNPARRNGVDYGFRSTRFRPLISQADDVAMFTKLIETMKPTERLDVLAELLDTTPSTP